ncbi:hypothetical protein L210DRAFT_3413994, partial [Boletus edulis BED1]
RTRLQRNQQMHEAWQAQMPVLVAQYLEWKHGKCTDAAIATNVTDHVFHVEVVGLRAYDPRLSVNQRLNELANVALIRTGALGCSPMQPTLAVKFECLELYHQLRRRQSSLSIQAITKVVCALHNLTYSHHLREQFSIAFDIYLNILRLVQSALNQVLGRDGAAWKLCGACPCCAYEQPDEPALSPTRLHCMDGNHSAKRLDGSGHADPRVFRSDYFIADGDVERFKDEVRSRASSSGVKAGTCTDNWNAAKPGEENKIQVFEQTGIFLLACRHGFVECIAEMKRSGELAKYTLAAVNQVLQTCGKDQAIGHDIGCSSSTTVANSTLGARAKESNLKIVVNVFHGYAHNHACQLANHPLYLSGFGNEDLETCERIFSSSNSTAPLIRHASYFHWKQFLDLHFDQWDKDKYLELGKFLFNNYKKALRIIKKYGSELDHFKAATNITDADFIAWLEEEKQYLRDCAQESRETTTAFKYAELLDKLHFAEATYGSVTSVPFLTYTPAQYTPESGLNTAAQQCTTAVNAEYASALRRYQLQLNVVEKFERDNNITERWMIDHLDYKATLEYSKHRNFIRAVEELEGLVVQRLFELSKANLSGTGYKLRKQVSKALMRRSAAVRAALDHYNKLTPRQKPPRKKLEYSDVIGYVTLGEFSLLKSSRHDILSKPWASSANREAMTRYFKVIRSQEEIVRLNVEIRRLQVWVDFDDEQIRTAIDKLKADSSPNLAAEMGSFYAERHRVNNIHRSRLAQVYSLDGYSGVRPAYLFAGRSESDDHEVDEEDEVANRQAFSLGETLDRMS